RSGRWTSRRSPACWWRAWGVLRRIRVGRDGRMLNDVDSSRPVAVKVRRLPGGEDVPLPRAMTEHAAGLDVCAAVGSPGTVETGEIATVPCGLAVVMPPGYEAQIRTRSGLASRHGVTVVNATGTIDADYRGEVKVALVNLGREAFTVERGMRIAQMVV